MNKSSDTERQQLIEQVVPRLGALHRCFASRRDEFMQDKQLTQSQLELLFMIKHRPMTIGEVAEGFAITPSAVSQIVGQLEKRGMVSRDLDKNDRRITYVKISPKAEKSFRKMRDKFVEYMNENLMEVSTDELQTLVHTLDRLNNALEKEK